MMRRRLATVFANCPFTHVLSAWSDYLADK